ncbi:diaminopimelate decarboxylase [Lentibacillus amyloliquefaciens]|uniref:Diaminopimelate decarboxylase n=1 Tax=Lentibacillus amyloliquefaciens TaxID=1472767 RepID=A0A0U3WDZ3_9BACI|nr:diaminopimelate decarboxylase [Lentibacillus amyloliquefaciens]ALX47999.1 diaminopimelate decarboxylase [Lentibacillus amyloliquefaciens]
MILDHHPYTINEAGHLAIGGMDAVELANKYGTPLYVFDVSLIRENCRAFVNTFQELGVRAQVAYASKAFSSVAMLQVIRQENLSLDVVSQGELYTALLADFPVKKIHLHGNNKSYEELEMAIDNDIGCIVVDNFQEIDLISHILQEKDKTISVLMRVTPGIEPNTHQYIVTGNEDSKFGFSLENGQADKAFLQLYEHEKINFKGLHNHIGSQIFETEVFQLSADILFHKLAEWHAEYNFVPEVLNLGGGFGIRYTEDDQPLSYAEHVNKIVTAVQDQSESFNLPMPEIWIEPGRSIVGNAGITLYSVGSMKEIPGVRKYISVDGGMTDNIRPALYQAKYEAVLANKAALPASESVSVAGKCCESGDMLIWDLSVPEIDSDDILAVFSTGAYGYSMANHYNRFAKPAAVFVEDGNDKLVVKRETYHDVVKNDISYE